MAYLLEQENKKEVIDLKKSVLLNIAIATAIGIGFHTSADAADRPLSMKERVTMILADCPFSSYYKGGSPTIVETPEEAIITKEYQEEELSESDQLIAESAYLREQLENKILKNRNLQQKSRLNYEYNIEQFNDVEIVEDSSLGGFEEEYYSDDCLFLDYHSGKVDRVLLTPGYLTDIQLQEGETLERITMGDRSRWEVHTYYDDIKDTYHVYIQPTQNDLETNIIIATNRHHYQLLLVASAFNNPIVKWNYPNEQLMFSKQENKAVIMEVNSPDKLNFDYAISRKNNYNWIPRYVFDDGFNTYMTIDPDIYESINPAIFTINRLGNMVLVDYEKINGNIVIHDVLDNMQINVGTKFIKINRKR